MTYHQIIQLKNGASCCLRSGTAADGQAALDNFILTHAETDNLLTYPEENTLTATQEGEYLQAKTESPNSRHRGREGGRHRRDQRCRRLL